MKVSHEQHWLQYSLQRIMQHIILIRYFCVFVECRNLCVCVCACMHAYILSKLHFGKFQSWPKQGGKVIVYVKSGEKVPSRHKLMAVPFQDRELRELRLW